MRPIHVAQMDKARPVLILTRELVRPHLSRVTVAPITSSARGLSTEVPCGAKNGLTDTGVISCDNITTISARSVGKQIGHLLDSQEAALTAAIHAAFDLE